jgi:hypothetical protein
MSWLPPPSLGARTEWARVHPWVAGWNFGFLMAALFGVVLAFETSPWIGLAGALLIWPVTALVFAVLAKQRFGERADADEHPLPTVGRAWSQASDRFLRGMMTIGVLAALACIVGLVRSGRSVIDGVGLVSGAWLAASVFKERKLRRS